MFGMFGGGHGHSHAPGAQCDGHGHGELGGKKMEMTEEMRQKLMRQLEEHMEMMIAAGQGHNHGQVISPGRVLHDPTSPDPGPYNHILYGYGHEPASMPHGWDSLVPSPPPMTNPTMPLSLEEMMQQISPVERDRYWLLNVPWFGRLRVVKDRGGLMQGGIVILYWLYGNWSTWNAILLPYYSDGLLPLFLLLLYAAISILCISSFIRASTLNPGSLHADLHPQDEWTECKVCHILRPPLSHHCRRCGHCVRRMDHHCPWIINNCVGEENQFAFMLLLIYAFLLSAVTIVTLFLYFFRFGVCMSCSQESFVIQHQNAIVYVDAVLAIVMLISSAGLIFSQHISIIHETPTVEWMKQQREMFLSGRMSPLHKTVKPERPVCDIYGDLCGAPLYFWLFPCRRRQRHAISATVGV